MSRLWFISDTHFNHANILNFTNHEGVLFRGSLFKNFEDMNSAMIERWNSVVGSNDKVYHLGDVFMGKDYASWIQIFKQLNGTKVLIAGNHDDIPKLCSMNIFKSIYAYRRLDAHKIILSHIPLSIDSIPTGYINVHGHTHSMPYSYPYVNICVEHINYTPITVDRIHQLAKKE